VGGGFDQSQLERVYRLLRPLKTPQSPFKRTPPANEPVQWVKPVLICEVKFAEWTRDRRLRQPIYLGLRDDKEPAECTFEVKRDTRLELTKVESNAALRGPFEQAKIGSAIDTIATAKRNSQQNSSEPGKSTHPHADDHSESKKKSRPKQAKRLNRRPTS
jgi:bifunctional non-homologous end joining protein LigD